MTKPGILLIIGGTMNREELKGYIGTTAFSLGHVEKDYFQHIILSGFSRRLSSSLVFKGGTALQKTGIIQRFSEDLDFTQRKNVSIQQLADIAVKSISSYNYGVEVDSFSAMKNSESCRLKIIGPLFRNNQGFCSIRLEVSKRESILKKPLAHELNPLYTDILPYIVSVMDTSEIAAEKIRAILTRDKVRDVYDLYKLVEQGVEFNRSLINEKLSFYNLEFNASSFLRRCEILSKTWKVNLRSLMQNVPSKKEALKIIFNNVDKMK